MATPIRHTTYLHFQPEIRQTVHRQHYLYYYTVYILLSYQKLIESTFPLALSRYWFTYYISHFINQISPSPLILLVGIGAIIHQHFTLAYVRSYWRPII
jgi:hypothetical protein